MLKENHYSSLWVEKYRPKTIDDIVLKDDLKKEFLNITQDIPNILLCGKPGIGKTSLAKLIINSILKCQYIYINASNENGIDTIRNKVVSFAQTKSFDGLRKTILLDEMDAMTGNAMRSLRSIMEEYSETCRFILTANYYNSIIEPIRSRCLIYNIEPDFKGCLARCVHILKTENIKIENPKILIPFITKRFPDLRKIINELQKYSITGYFTPKIDDENFDFYKNFWVMVKEESDSNKIRQKIIDSDLEFDSDYQVFYRNLFSIVLNDKKIEESKQKEILIQIGEYMFRDLTVLDREINFFCLILYIKSIL